MEGLLQLPQDFLKVLGRLPIQPHSCSMLMMSFCKLAWKEKVVKLEEALIDKLVWSVQEVKA